MKMIRNKNLNFTKKEERDLECVISKNRPKRHKITFFKDLKERPGEKKKECEEQFSNAHRKP